MSALAQRVLTLIDDLSLSFEDVGEIVDASGRSVARWCSGDVVPQRLNKQRLIELAYVAEQVTQVLPREDANLWMFTPSKFLGNDSPANKIRRGEYKDVLDLIEALADGVVM